MVSYEALRVTRDSLVSHRGEPENNVEVAGSSPAPSTKISKMEELEPTQEELEARRQEELKQYYEVVHRIGRRGIKRSKEKSSFSKNLVIRLRK